MPLILSHAARIGWAITALLVCWLVPAATHAASRPLPKPYLNMPQLAGGVLPAQLSQTGAFTDVRTLTPAKGLIPYELIVPFWSDGASKSRYIALPRGRIDFTAEGEWRFPPGTVFVKTFELPAAEDQPQGLRRLETRLLVRDRAGGVYGVTYRWRADGSDADLLLDSRTESIAVKTRGGAAHTQSWYYPSRADCLTCHTAKAGYVLGVKTRQLNRPIADGGTNQLLQWSELGMLQPSVSAAQLEALPRLAASDDASRSLEDRARSYLDANCAQCHRPGGTVAYFDARYETPLAQQGMVNGPVLIDQGVDRPRVVSPHDIWRSILYMRVNTDGDVRMPPLARETIDAAGVTLLAQWIDSMPGRDVLPPPGIAPAGGEFSASIQVTLSDSDPDAAIHYTTDGSVPGATDPLYTQPITLKGTAVIRARAFRDGYTRSITAQQVFSVSSP